MASTNRSRLVRVLSFLGVGAGLGLGIVLIRPGADRPAGPAVAPQAVTTGASAIPSATPAAHRAGRPAIDAPAPASEALRQVLPEQTDHIADWREFTPERLTVRFDDRFYATYRVERVERDTQRTVLTARLEGGEVPEAAALGGSFLVATANASDRWDALAVFPGLEYHVTVRGGSVTVAESPTLAMPCATDVATASDAPAAPEPAVPSAADHNGETHVDVLFLYNTRALSERNGDTLTIDADCSNYIASSNTVLENSRVTAFRWRYLGAVAAPAYQDNDDTANDLRSMSGTGEIATFVRDTQRSYGADQVVMLVGGIKRDAAGRAWLAGPVAHSVVNYPFPTFTDGSRGTTTTSYATTCHELGHNFGCQHQRNDPSTNAADGDGKFNYGFVYPRGSFQVGTMMSVYIAPTSLSRIPYFSSPELTYESTTIGVAATEPRAAFNVRTLVDNAARVAGLETTITAPAITTQPASTTATVGQRVTFSVTASGGNLSYAWAKDGTSIPVQSATFSIVSASAASAGSYTVTVSNRLGSVTSEPAVLTVNSAAPPAPAAPSGGGGGGGGGSAGAGFVLTGALWLLVRRAAHASGRSAR